MDVIRKSTYSICEKCNDTVSNFAFNRHFKSCKGIYKNLRCKIKKSDIISQFEIISENIYKCSYCFKEYCKNGIMTHIWLNHTEKGKYFNINRINKNKGRVPWNKGLTKETDFRIKSNFLKTPSKSKGKKLTQEHKDKVSKGMKKAVLEGRQKTPSAGRAKSRKIKNILNKEFTLRGSWEEKFALMLNQNEIIWESGKRHSYYDSENNLRSYFPDFYLIEFGIYVEIKGFETEKDKLKWKYFNYKLIVLKQKDLKLLNVI